MPIIPFNRAAEDFDAFLESVPEFDETDEATLKEWEGKVRDTIHALDAVEPKNENSEAYDLWAQQHEDLEDILDEILDCLEELN